MNLLQISFYTSIFIAVILLLRVSFFRYLPKITFSLFWDIVLIRLLLPIPINSRFSIYQMIGNNQTNTAVPFPSQPKQLFWDYMGLVWIIGAICVVIIFCIAYYKCYCQFRVSLPAKQTKLQKEFLKKYPLIRKVSIRVSDRTSTPLTYGFLRPVILLPKYLAENEDLLMEIVLSHEMAHIRRWDNFRKLLLVLAVVIHWFNPLVWGYFFLANKEIELACDEAVLTKLGQDGRSHYAMALISMEEQKLSCPLCSYFQNTTQERIVAIMSFKKRTFAGMAAAFILVAGTSTVFATTKEPVNKKELQKVKITTTVPMENVTTTAKKLEDARYEFTLEDGTNFIVATENEAYKGGDIVISVTGKDGSHLVSTIKEEDIVSSTDIAPGEAATSVMPAKAVTISENK